MKIYIITHISNSAFYSAIHEKIEEKELTTIGSPNFKKVLCPLVNLRNHRKDAILVWNVCLRAQSQVDLLPLSGSKLRNFVAIDKCEIS